jgi:hypothetical protein
MNVVARRLIPLSRFFQSRATSLPKAGFGSEADRLFMQWLCFVGVLLFAAYLCWRANIWGILVAADPTGITLMIIAVFCASTVWVGLRAWMLMRERQALDAWKQAALPGYGAPQAPAAATGVVHDYFSGLLDKSRRRDYDNAQLTEVLAERLHGPSESAWWVNGIQIKLGLLGKVIGFSILAIDISNMQTFDASQSAAMLRTLTGGLGIALLTTAVGLVANMLLGVQLVRMDRCGDGILADSLEFAETGFNGFTHREPQRDRT